MKYFIVVVFSHFFLQVYPMLSCKSRLWSSTPLQSYFSTKGTKLSLTTNIVVVGKKNGVETWIADGIYEYEKRLRPVMTLNTIYNKNDDELLNCVSGLSSKGTIIALDENGKTFNSKDFSDYYYKSLEQGGATVTFVIGAFDGLPKDILDKYPTISLSKMTWTHQMARLLLTEQIYRAVEIRKGSGYHKE